MKKVIFTLVVTICVVFLCNVKAGFTQGQGMEERMDYLETRLSELSSIQNDYDGILKEHGAVISSVKGLQDRVSLGVGLRTTYSMTQDASGGRSWDKNFNITSMRLYFGAKVTDNIRLEINTETFNETNAFGVETAADDIRLLDAFAEYKWNDYFHIRFGRHLPASDRYNLDGPYYQNSFFFPLVAQRYPNKAVGRVEGVSYWGQHAGGKFKWQFTASDGREIPGGSNAHPDHLQYSGRLTYNFWEPESGFYNSSTYYGKKDVLAIGLVGFHQTDGVGTATDPRNFDGWNVDFLLEKHFGWGTIDIEAAYFDYNTHGAVDDEKARTDGQSAQSDGQAWEGGVSYLYPEKIGWGQPQFVSRWQSFNPTNNQTAVAFAESKLEFGLHYIIQDHNAKVALIWSNTHLGGSSNEDVNAVTLGMQFQH
ncbi:MAG: hypothetical protein NUV86_10515 [Candidatus Scalindua sp.]|nr:hypothetical protein [Candidatus Scalindua sp.]